MSLCQIHEERGHLRRRSQFEDADEEIERESGGKCEKAIHVRDGMKNEKVLIDAVSQSGNYATPLPRALQVQESTTSCSPRDHFKMV